MKKPPEGGFSLCCSAPVSNGGLIRGGISPGCLPERSGGRSGQGQSLDFGGQAALVASSLVLVEDALVGHGVNHGLHLGEGFGGFGLVASGNCFSTFFTAVRYLERSEVFAALILTSWRTRLRPDARRGFFFLGLADAMIKFPWCLRMMQQSPPLYQATLPRVSLFKALSTVSLLTLLSRVTGLVRDLLMASAFGASAMTDAFYVAFRIPNLLRRLFGEGAFSQAFVPALASAKAKDGEASAIRLISSVATVLFWVLVLTCVLGVAGAPVLVWALASGMRQDPQGFEAAVLMTRWMFPYIGFMSLVALSAGVLNTWKRFAVPAATPVLLNIAMIAAAWLGAPWLAGHGIEPIYAMAGGVMLGGVLQLGVQIPVLKRLGLLPRIGLAWAEIRTAWADPGTRTIARMMLPALLGCQRGAGVIVDQHPDRLASGLRQRDLVVLCRSVDGIPHQLAGCGTGRSADAATCSRACCPG
jgi:hypothetical protein